MEASLGTDSRSKVLMPLLMACSEAIEDLTGGVTQELFTTDILDKDKFWTDELLKVNEEFLFSCSTGTFDKWQGSDVASRTGARSGVIRLHAYSVMDAVEVNGERLVKVRYGALPLPRT